MKIEYSQSPDSEDIEFLTDKINAETLEYGNASPFAFFMRNENGKIIAGANGFVLYGMIYTDQLWVDESYRKQGYAKKIMEQVHKLGIEKKCKMATVSTMSFQNAVGFYEKLGYKKDFTRFGCAGNSACIFMSKSLVDNSDDTALKITQLALSEIDTIVKAFDESGWTTKPKSLFEQYLLEKNKGDRLAWLAYYEAKFAGYVTLKWQSDYRYFAVNNIPEIMDLNVLPNFRNKGIGSKLLDIAEKEAGTKSDQVGIGVGLYKGKDGGYGAAQKLYVKRGYIPDGNGATYGYQFVVPGKEYAVDDGLVLWFLKEF